MDSLDLLALFEVIEKDDLAVHYFVVGRFELLLLATVIGRAYAAHLLLGNLGLIEREKCSGSRNLDDFVVFLFDFFLFFLFSQFFLLSLLPSSRSLPSTLHI